MSVLVKFISEMFHNIYLTLLTYLFFLSFKMLGSCIVMCLYICLNCVCQFVGLYYLLNDNIFTLIVAVQYCNRPSRVPTAHNSFVFITIWSRIHIDYRATQICSSKQFAQKSLPLAARGMFRRWSSSGSLIGGRRARVRMSAVVVEISFYCYCLCALLHTIYLERAVRRHTALISATVCAAKKRVHIMALWAPGLATH